MHNSIVCLRHKTHHQRVDENKYDCDENKYHQSHSKTKTTNKINMIDYKQIAEQKHELNCWREKQAG